MILTLVFDVFLKNSFQEIKDLNLLIYSFVVNLNK